MQNRIKELAIESGAKSMVGGPYYMSIDSLQRFAQAIARECADLAIECRSEVVEASARRPVGEQPSRDYLQGVYGCGGLIDKEIRARFGLGE